MTITKITKQLSILFICVTIIHNTQAQFIAPKIIENYSKSTISKLFEVVTSAIVMDFDKQIKIANYYEAKDSIINSYLIQKFDFNILVKLVDSLNSNFDKLLSYEELVRYNTKKYKKFIEYDCQADLLIANKKYQVDTNLQNSFYKITAIKNQHTIKQISNIKNSSLQDSSYNIYNKCDSLNQGYIVVAKGQPYFKDKVNLLDKIMQIQPTDLKELIKGFNNNCISRGNNYYLNFLSSMQWNLKDSIYFKTLYTDSIENIANEKSKTELEEYIFKYGISNTIQKKILPILLEKNKRIAFLEISKYHSKERDSLFREANENAWFNIKKFLLRFGYYKGIENKLINVMKLQKLLQLGSNQLDSLVEYNYYLDKLKYNVKINNNEVESEFNDYQRMKIKNLLREGQFDTLINVQAKAQALYNTQLVWYQLSNLKLTNNIDSASNFNQILYYKTELLKIAERYYFDITKYYEVLRMLKTRKPAILKKLEYENELLENNLEERNFKQ